MTDTNVSMHNEFSKVKRWFYNRTANFREDDLVPQVKEIITKFEDNNLPLANPDMRWTWKVMQDYLAWYGLGIKINNQRAKIVEVILKYGDNSMFWKELERSKLQRKNEWVRVAYICWLLYENPELLRGDKKRKGVLTMFLKQAVDYRKRLLVEPLTEKQRCYMWRIERILGIYYDDLSPEENGEIWRLEAMKKINEMEETNA